MLSLLLLGDILLIHVSIDILILILLEVEITTEGKQIPFYFVTKMLVVTIWPSHRKYNEPVAG